MKYGGWLLEAQMERVEKWTIEFQDYFVFFALYLCFSGGKKNLKEA